MAQNFFPVILILELDHETHPVPMQDISYTVHTVCISDLQSFIRVASSVHITCATMD